MSRWRPTSASPVRAEGTISASAVWKALVIAFAALGAWTAALILLIGPAANQALGAHPIALAIALGACALLALVLPRLPIGLERTSSRPRPRATRTTKRLSRCEMSIRGVEKGLADAGELSRALNSLTHRFEERQQASRMAQERFQGILDNANVAIHIKDADTRYVLVNREFERIRAVEGRDVVGRTEEEIHLRDGATQVDAFDREVIEKGTPVSFEEDIDTPDGRRTYLTVKFPIHRHDGAVTALAGISTDITEQKQALGRALEASQQKSQFVANMSHELRTPLNGVIGLTDLLRATQLSPLQSEYLDALARSSDALLGVINDVLDLAKIEAGRLELKSSDFELRDAVDEACLMLSEQARSKGLRIARELEERLPVTVTGDRSRLRQILLNLLSNAVKFTECGEIVVRVSMAAADTVRFEILDTGIGIDEETAEELFEAFVQGDRSSAARSGGTGLGLAIARELTSGMGGSIGAAPRPGGGSVFWFTAVLPAAATQATPSAGDAASKGAFAPPEPQTAGDDGHGEQRVVLVAEDNPINATVTEALLARQGVRAVVAHDGSEAVEMALAREYAAIFMDCQMPRLDGYEATRRIRAEEAARHVPIIAMTAHSMAGDRERCLAAGMDDYLSKPVRVEELELVVRRWIPPREYHEHRLALAAQPEEDVR